MNDLIRVKLKVIDKLHDVIIKENQHVEKPIISLILITYSFFKRYTSGIFIIRKS